MTTATALPQPARRRRLAAILLAATIGGGLAAALPDTEASAQKPADPLCTVQGERPNVWIDCG
jgi:ferric-dicitrate binding protein FerR (iron transport regulator)